jgi:hypothetical protein
MLSSPNPAQGWSLSLAVRNLVPNLLSPCVDTLALAVFAVRDLTPPLAPSLPCSCVLLFRHDFFQAMAASRWRPLLSRWREHGDSLLLEIPRNANEADAVPREKASAPPLSSPVSRKSPSSANLSCQHLDPRETARWHSDTSVLRRSEHGRHGHGPSPDVHSMCLSQGSVSGITSSLRLEICQPTDHNPSLSFRKNYPCSVVIQCPSPILSFVSLFLSPPLPDTNKPTYPYLLPLTCSPIVPKASHLITG